MSEPIRTSDDAELVGQLCAGDERAVANLAQVYGTRLHQLALRYVRNAEDAEQIVQDVLFKVVGKIGDFRGDAALSSWLYRITCNAAMSRLRRRRAARVTTIEVVSASDQPEHAIEVADRSVIADEIVLRRQLRTRLVSAVRGLPAIYRHPVILRDLHGLSTAEASSVLRLNGQTLKSRLHRGRLLLRQELSDFSGGLELHRAVS